MRKEQKEKRNEEIINTALELFSKYGYADTKVTDIAKAVNMSTGLLFHYYESKEKLYFTLLERGIEEINNKMKNLIKEPIDYFRCVLDTVFSNIQENFQSAQIYVLIKRAANSETTPKEIKKYILDNFRRIFDINITKLILGQSKGQIKKGNPEAMVKLFWDCIDGIVSSYIMDTSRPLPEPEWIIDMLKNHSLASD
ncbi:MAG: TetR/AcrR family transcriptional regulator [Clostridiales bacterium]|nr:TetR/AcrR family transcriptional regulator [Clostridiales bacterium]